MRLLFCNLCGYRMASDSQFCEGCGASSATQLPVASRLHRPSKVSRTTAFFASQATLCLFTLLVFLGLAVALAPAGWRYASLQLQSGSGPASTTSDTRGLGVSNTLAHCNQIVVIFNSTATVARVSALLEQLDSTIAFGPNENGAFELSTPSTTAAGVAEALNRASDAVVNASLQRRCL